MGQTVKSTGVQPTPEETYGELVAIRQNIEKELVKLNQTFLQIGDELCVRTDYLIVRAELEVLIQDMKQAEQGYWRKALIPASPRAEPTAD